MLKSNNTSLSNLYWVDSNGNKYDQNQIMFIHIDTPGSQFLGWVTKESKKISNKIEDWIEVQLVTV